MTGYCRSCGSHHEIPTRLLGKVAGLAIGAATTGSASRDPLLSLAGALVGTALGHVADEVLARRCPECGEFLEILADVMG